MDRLEIYKEVEAERLNQIRQHGSDNDEHNIPNDWLAHIIKHLGRAWTKPFDRLMFRQQMIRVAALAVAAVGWVDKR